MFKPFIRLLAFFRKEFNEIRRQPRLVLSLLLGPFLILLLFGVGYQRDRPLLRTALVLPPEGISELDNQALEQIGGLNFTLVSVGNDREEALRQLQAGELDVVQIFPSNIRERVLRGESATVDFTYNEINPINIGWIQYLAYAQVVEINKAILLNSTSSLQQEAKDTQGQLTEVGQQLDALDQSLAGTDRERLQQSIRRLKESSAALAVSALLLQPQSSGVDGEATRAELLQLQRDLDELDRAISDGTLEQRQEQLRTTRERVRRLETATGQISAIPPGVIVSPLQQNYNNLTDANYNLMTFYAPAVVALLVQHIAITLASLSLVREQLLGATEIFRVAPVRASHMLLGKYLGYTLFIAIITAVLVGLLSLIGIPFLGNPLLFAGLVLLLTLASLGVGFFLSAISRSDSQAVQFSMLVLLLSIFFSGFFLELRNFWEPVRLVGYALPLTHGINGFQALLLRGTPPPPTVWASLGLISAVTFLAALLFSARQFRRG